MQDPRLRLIAAASASLAAFSGITGALLALGWWILFTPGVRLFRRNPAPWSMFGIILMAGLVSRLTGGCGLEYALRTGVIFLIAMWAYAEYRPGEFLDLSGSLFGNRTGFDLGLIAELAMEALGGIRQDATMIQYALRIKGAGLRARLTGLSLSLLTNQMKRSAHIADQLRIRGYTTGGSVCPEFVSTLHDRTAAVSATGVLAISVALSGQVFIVL
ncbi:MAG: hypothetical protein ACXQTN_00960 [Methanoculleaceae archaeon]